MWRNFIGTALLSAGLSQAAVAQVYYIDLGSQPLTVPGRTFYVKQVEDGRANRAGVGTVLRGLGNTPQRAELKPTVPAALLALLTAQLPTRPTDQPLLAVVRAVAVQEKITLSSEQATDDLALDFYLLDAGGQAHFALSTSETVESRGLETTGRHPRQLAQALQACLLPLAQLDWAQVAARPAVDPAQVLAGPPPALDYPVLTAAERPAGFYRTFLDFRNNAPVTAPALLVETTPNGRKGWEGTYEYYPYLPAPGGGRGEPLRGVWGFSDGKQLYVWHRKSYRLLVRQGNDFSFVGGSEADPGAVSTAGMVGGLVGAGIASASTSGRPTDYTLHVLTGRITALADEPPAPNQTVPLYIYSRRSAVTVAPQPVYLNGTQVGQLGENQVLNVPYADHQHEVRLRLGAPTGPELVFQPDFQAPVYVKVARKADNPAKSPLEVVPAKVGKIDVGAISPAEPGTE